MLLSFHLGLEWEYFTAFTATIILKICCTSDEGTLMNLQDIVLLLYAFSGRYLPSYIRSYLTDLGWKIVYQKLVKRGGVLNRANYV